MVIIRYTPREAAQSRRSSYISNAPPLTKNAALITKEIAIARKYKPSNVEPTHAHSPHMHRVCYMHRRTDTGTHTHAHAHARALRVRSRSHVYFLFATCGRD